MHLYKHAPLKTVLYTLKTNDACFGYRKPLQMHLPDIRVVGWCAIVGVCMFGMLFCVAPHDRRLWIQASRRLTQPISAWTSEISTTWLVGNMQTEVQASLMWIPVLAVTPMLHKRLCLSVGTWHPLYAPVKGNEHQAHNVRPHSVYWLVGRAPTQVFLPSSEKKK